MNNEDKIILDLCGGSGAWSQPYADAGYDVRLITLPAFDVRNYVPPPRVHGILAAPPCTEFSLAKTTKDRDFGSALEIIKNCLRIIWMCRIEGTLKFWCLENPRALLRQFIGIPAVSVGYWQFGDGIDKPTDLFGYFNPPKPKCKVKPKKLVKITEAYNWDGRKSERTAVTPPGFAKAFFLANQ